MHALISLFGQGKELSLIQMSLRAAFVFVIALIVIRLSGRRSFGMRTPFDNVITILLGAILSRAVVGASPFLSTLAAAVVLAGMHRLFAWIALYSNLFGKLIKGEAKVIYKDQNPEPDRKQMGKCLVSEKDVLEGIRINSNLDSMQHAKMIYVERNGQISVVKK
ncbi:MAG TPA: hypothetical protein VGO45_12095 [Bacteroidia bacterium]|jgi:uncharacterized membrane protein YcaP (DUF421 family)|nr:hypothetical protein [Bacteroidia bacterium]